MLLWSFNLIIPAELISILPAMALVDSVVMLLPCLSFKGPVAPMITLPASPLPVFALEMELPESMLRVPKVKLTEPAAPDVEDAAEIAPPV